MKNENPNRGSGLYSSRDTAFHSPLSRVVYSKVHGKSEMFARFVCLRDYSPERLKEEVYLYEKEKGNLAELMQYAGKAKMLTYFVWRCCRSSARGSCACTVSSNISLSSRK